VWCASVGASVEAFSNQLSIDFDFCEVLCETDVEWSMKLIVHDCHGTGGVPLACGAHGMRPSLRVEVLSDFSEDVDTMSSQQSLHVSLRSRELG